MIRTDVDVTNVVTHIANTVEEELQLGQVLEAEAVVAIHDGCGLMEHLLRDLQNGKGTWWLSFPLCGGTVIGKALVALIARLVAVTYWPLCLVRSFCRGHLDRLVFFQQV